MSSTVDHAYLVTGAAGTIGRLVFGEFLLGRKVRVLTRSRSGAVILPSGG